MTVEWMNVDKKWFSKLLSLKWLLLTCEQIGVRCFYCPNHQHKYKWMKRLCFVLFRIEAKFWVLWAAMLIFQSQSLRTTNMRLPLNTKVPPTHPPKPLMSCYFINHSALSLKQPTEIKGIVKKYHKGQMHCEATKYKKRGKKDSNVFLSFSGSKSNLFT